MHNFDEVFERIKLSTNTRTQMEIAEVLEIRQSSISDAKRRNSVPADWFMKLFEKFGLNPDWLKKSTGPMYLRNEQGYSPVDLPAGAPNIALYESAAQYSEPDAKSVVVSVYSSTYPYSDENMSKSTGKLSIPLSYAVSGLYTIKYEASSMSPLIKRGAYVGIDTTQKNVISGELYGVNLPYEAVVIKRVYLDVPNNMIIMKAENKEHPDTTLPLESLGSTIIGRVSWILQKL